MTRFSSILRAFAPIGVCALVACATQLPQLPPNVSVGPKAVAMPTPIVGTNTSPAMLQAIHFSSLDVARGGTWSGSFVTSTNTASVEVRTNLFSIDVPRTRFGRYAFMLNVLDTPPIFVRAYRLRVIARNVAGDEVEEDLPFHIR